MSSRALPTLAAIAFALLGFAASAGASERRTAAPIPGGPGHRPIAGWAFLDRGNEIAGAKVTLSTLGGRAIPGGTARTNRTGRFTLSPRAADLPSTFVVSVRGGSIARRRQPSSVVFSAIAHKARLDRQIVYVGLASTVVRRYLRADPGAGEATVVRRVRRILGIPTWHNLAYDLYTISPRWYAGSKVLRVAAARGGMGRLAAELTRAARRGRRPAHPPLASPPRAVAAQSSAWFLEKLAGGAVSAAGGQGAGWLFNEIGFSDTPAYVSEIESQLSELKAELDQLEDEVAAINTAVQQTYFATLSVNLDAARSAIDTAMEHMNYLTGITDDANRAYWAQTYFDQDITPIATDQKPWGSTRVLIDEVLVDVPPGETPLGLQGALYIKSEDPFWTFADSQQAVQLVDFWEQYANEALDIYLEYQHQVGGQDHCDSPPTDAGCPLQNEVTLTEQLNDNAIATLKDSSGKHLQPVPSGFMVDIRSGLMWCVACYPAPMAATDAELGLETGYYNNVCCLPFTESNTMLTLPRLQELAGLMSGCNCASNRSGVQWLVDKAELTSTYLDADGPGTPSPGNVYVWSRDAQNCNPTACNYYTAELKSGQATGSTNSFNYTPQYYLPNRVPAATELPFYP